MRVLSHYLKWLAGYDVAETQTTASERACLAKHAADKTCLVEIGVWEGVTTKVLRRSMAANATLFAVDPFPTGRLGISLHERIARSEVGKINRGRVVWIREIGRASLEESQKNGLNQADFVFIDGDHSYEAVRLDWMLWSANVAIHGIIALHDSRSTHARKIDDAGSVVFTQEAILSNPQFRLIDVVDSLTVVERSA